jgi:hypothetical protein
MSSFHTSFLLSLSLIWGMLLRFSCMHIATFHRVKPVISMLIPHSLGWGTWEIGGMAFYDIIDLFSQVEIVLTAPLAAPYTTRPEISERP